MMNRSDFRRQLQEGLNTVFGLEYRRHPEQWRDIFDVETSAKAYEEDVLMFGFGAASVKPEGTPIDMDDMGESWVARYVHETIALGFAITEEAEEDGLYGSIGAKGSKALARSFIHTKEVKGANILNNGFDTDFPGGDDQPLFSTDHPLAGGGTLSNTLPTPADLAEASMEELLVLIGDWTDDRGIPIVVNVKKLIIPTELEFIAARLLLTEFQPDSGDNNVNAIKKLGKIANGFAVNNRLTDPDAWFFKTDQSDGLKHMVRKAMAGGVVSEGDFSTGNLRYKKRERYSFGWTDWRGAAGVPGN
jgi:hypothetical protein